MNIDKVLMEYDSMFGVSSMEQIMDFLTEKLEEALGEQDIFSAITLLNEIIGFCRDTSQNDKGEMYSIIVQLVVEERSKVRGAGVPDPPIHRPAPIGSRLC